MTKMQVRKRRLIIDMNRLFLDYIGILQRAFPLPLRNEIACVCTHVIGTDDVDVPA